MIHTTRLFRSLIHRLSGTSGSAAPFDPADVFRDFAAGVERRLAEGGDGGPKVRLPASEPAAGRLFR